MASNVPTIIEENILPRQGLAQEATSRNNRNFTTTFQFRSECCELGSSRSWILVMDLEAPSRALLFHNMPGGEIPTAGALDDLPLLTKVKLF